MASSEEHKHSVDTIHPHPQPVSSQGVKVGELHSEPSPPRSMQVSSMDLSLQSAADGVLIPAAATSRSEAAAATTAASSTTAAVASVAAPVPAAAGVKEAGHGM